MNVLKNNTNILSELLKELICMKRHSQSGDQQLHQ